MKKIILTAAVSAALLFALVAGTAGVPTKSGLPEPKYSAPAVCRGIMPFRPFGDGKGLFLPEPYVDCLLLSSKNQARLKDKSSHEQCLSITMRHLPHISGGHQ
jgi:hypothetical protein